MEMCNPRIRSRPLQMLFKLIKLIKKYNNKMSHPINKRATTYRIVLLRFLG